MENPKVTNKAVKDITGQRFGRLTVLEYAGTNNWHKSLWLCRCDCGNEKIIAGESLRRNRTRSCGCLDHEKHLSSPNRKVHGMHGTRIYRIWKGMKTRCTNTNIPDFNLYGGRGIEVCGEWLNDFQAFYDWAMANGYSDDLTIDRIDVNGNYEPSNCRWVTIEVQANNKRNVKLYEYNGNIHSLSEWAAITGINRRTLYYRICISHWDIEKALTKGVC